MFNSVEKGAIGEGIACRFVESKGFKITDRNYRKKWGELDIVAEKDGIIHFFEVKSLASDGLGCSNSGHNPEENVHTLKTRRLRRIMGTYLAEKGDRPFAFHVLSVLIDMRTKQAKVKWLKDLVI